MVLNLMSINQHSCYVLNNLEKNHCELSYIALVILLFHFSLNTRFGYLSSGWKGRMGSKELTHRILDKSHCRSGEYAAGKTKVTPIIIAQHL